MDPSVLIQPFLHFWYFIPLVVLLAVFHSSWFKGHLGDFIAAVSARLFFDKSHYHLTKNVTLPTEESIAQLYQVIVFDLGICNGSQGMTVFKYFNNSLLQNHQFFKALQKLIEPGRGPIHSSLNNLL